MTSRPAPAVTPVIALGRRTAIGTAGHAFADLDVIALAGPVLREVADRARPLQLPVDDVILGNCLGPGGNIARVAALAAGIGESVPGITVDRQCGSGLEAVRQAAALIRAGDARLILAGGAESASTAPWRFWPPNGGDPVRYQRAPFAPPGFPDPDMGPAADVLADRRDITRERQDAYAARSHARTVRARDAGVFDVEIVPVRGVQRDDRPRPGMDHHRLARLRPAFGGTATAGNSCGISDGAAVVAVTTEADALRAGLPYLRILDTTVVAGEPALPGAAPAPAIRRLLACLDRAPPGSGPGARTSGSATGIGVATGIGTDIAVEITEAFASVVLAVVDDLGLDEEQVCAEGGAIGLGHPWGASGALLLLRLASRLQAPAGPTLGVAACAVGGGQGIAMLVEHPGRSASEGLP